MQVRLDRGGAAPGVRSVTRLAFFAGLPVIGALALSAPEAALAACGPSHPAGIHSGTGTGVHTATSRPSAGGGGAGGGTLGCANGASAPAPHGLAMASSGRVIEGAHGRAHIAAHPRAAATRTANTSAHLRGVNPPHHP